MAFNKQQQQALDEKGSTIVSASAGTGKTAVLTQKVTDLILSGVEVQNILTMTFSNAAAAEMRERIKNKIEDCLKDNKYKSLRPFLKKQIAEMDESHIQTIHSFCSDVIKDNAYIVNVDPGYGVASDIDVAVLKKMAIDKVLLEEYTLNRKDFNMLYDYFDKTDTPENFLIGLHDDVSNMTDSENWLLKQREIYASANECVPPSVIDSIVQDLKISLGYAKSAYRNGADYRNPEDGTHLPLKTMSVLEDECAVLDRAIKVVQSGKIEEVNCNLFNEYGTRITIKDNITKELRNKGREFIAKYTSCSFSLKEQLSQMTLMTPCIDAIIRIEAAFKKEYSALKKARNILDFNDLEHLAYEILAKPNIAYRYKKRFAYIFVDEYQDTSVIQEEIINAVSSDNNLFCVGDLKQSIYRFRSSDPTLFTNRMDDYKTKSKKVISFNHNYRSCKNILDGTNDVFRYLSEFSKEIKYEENDYLIGDRDDSANTLQTPINLIMYDKNSIPNDIGLTATELEIYNIASLILNRVGKPIYDHKIKAMRNCEFRDFAVLARKISSYSGAFTRIFNKFHIPFRIDKPGSLLETVEIQTFMSLLELIVSPDNDISILTLFHQGLFNFNDEDLFDIRKNDQKKTLYKNICEIASTPTPLGKKCDGFIKYLSYYKSREFAYSMSKLVGEILYSSNILDIFAIKENGDKAVENLKMFLRLIPEFEKTVNGKIYGLLKHLHLIIKSGKTVNEAPSISDGNHVVITTIHRSKGLEYPIVILPFANLSVGQISLKENIIVDKDGGLGLKYFNPETNVRNVGCYRDSIKNYIRDKAREEEIRLLYVALTRPQEELYIQGSIPSDFGDFWRSSSMFSWVCSAVLCPRDIDENVDDDKDVANSFYVSPGLVGNWKRSGIDFDEIKLMTEDTPVVHNREFNLSKIVRPVLKEKSNIYPLAVSASQIDTLNQVSENSYQMPSVIQSSSSAKIGSVVHKILKNFDFKASMDTDTINSQIDGMIARGLLRASDTKYFDEKARKMLIRFLKTDFVKYTLSKATLYREVPIITTQNPLDGNVPITVKCIVDLIFEINSKIYVLDYKTDYVDDIEIIKAKHRSQVEIYKKGVEETFNKEVSGLYLALLKNATIQSY